MYADVTEAVLLALFVALGFWLRGRWDRRRRRHRFGGFIRQPLGASSLASRVASYTMTGTRTAEGNGSLNTGHGLRSVARVTLRERQSASRTGALGFSTDVTGGHPGRDMTVADWVSRVRTNDPALAERLGQWIPDFRADAETAAD